MNIPLLLDTGDREINISFNALVELLDAIT